MTYPTTARTLLGNIEHNLRGIRARVGDRLVLAAVKANAYGHGAAAVSQMIERTGAADWLGVATVEEGLQLRDAGVSLPILKFSPTRDVDDVTRALLAGITLSVVDEASIAQVAAAADALDLSDVAVHLKVDTGMRRVGAEPADARVGGVHRRPPTPASAGRVQPPAHFGQPRRRRVHPAAGRAVRRHGGRDRG